MSQQLRRVTIKDVARLSRVSPATVTRVMQGRKSVREETRSRVEEAVRALGYRPDHIARALVTRSSNTIGMMLPSSGDSFWGEVAAGIEQRASEAGFSVLFANAHGDARREAEVIDLFVGKRVDGIIIAGATGEMRSWVGGSTLHVPIVLVNWDATFQPELIETASLLPPRDMAKAISDEVRGRGFSHVAFDDLGGGVIAVKHLLSHRHSNIAFIGGSAIRPALLRILGFRRALEEAGLAPGPIIARGESLEAGMEGARSLLSRVNRPTAIVAYSDVVAIGVMRAAHMLGLRVPEDVSIVGFDDIDVAAFVEPPLTTIRQPKREMGSEAVSWILARLDGSDLREHQTLPGSLIVRSSSGPAPAGQAS